MLSFSRIADSVALVDKVVRHVEDTILAGKLAPNERLPPERELAGQLGVSRTVVRESLRILRAKGLIASTRGIGTTVLSVGRHHFTEPLTFYLRAKRARVSIEQYHEVRAALEVKMAEMAARNVNDEHLRILDDTIRELKEMDERQEAFPEIDARFHNCLADMASNPLLLIFLDAIQDLLTNARQKIKRDPRLRENTIRHHGAIIRCLRQRDAEGARRAMERHMAYALDALKSVLDDDVVHHKPAPRKGRPSQKEESHE